MIKIKNTSNNEILYATPLSAGFDICASEDAVIRPDCWEKIKTGLYIERTGNCRDENLLSWDWWDGKDRQKRMYAIPQLEIRARSGLSYKWGVTLLNGVGTVDADYPDEIGVLLINLGPEEFTVKAGDRIAQGVVTLALQLPGIKKRTAKRTGGFGSTGT